MLLSFPLFSLFDILTPASNHLQTEAIDFMQAYHIVISAKENIQKKFDKFYEIKNLADKFVKYLCDLDLLHDIEIQTEFPLKRTQNIKKISDKLIPNSVIIDPYKNFEITVYKTLINNAVVSIEQ